MEGNNENGSRVHAIKKEVEYQEKIANVEHEQLKNSIEKLEEKYESAVSHIRDKIEDSNTSNRLAIDAANKGMDNKHKFVLTIVVTMLGVTLGMTFTGDDNLGQEIYDETNQLERRIHEVELQMYDTRDITMQNDRLLDAIVSGNVMLRSEIEQDARLMDAINEVVRDDHND